MIENYSYVFIIGAGANKPYGFPLGEELYNTIKNCYSEYVADYYRSNKKNPIHWDKESKKADYFISQLEKTTGVSIDKYLNINKTFKDEGILAISASIYKSEKVSRLPFVKNIIGDWYLYLFQKTIQGLNTAEEFLNFNKNRISFITFNYDRSLEHFLFENLWGLLKNANVSRKELANIFLQIPFIHVYGKIGDLPWQKGFYEEKYDKIFHDSTIVEYGFQKKHLPFQIAQQVKDQLQIMYDERKNNTEIIEAHNLIEKADRIMFLGFGFDEQNLSILNLPKLLKDKQTYCTAYEKTENEINHIRNLLNFEKDDPKCEIYNFDSLMLLRECLI